VPIEDVAARGHVSVATIRYRVAHRQMSGPDRAGLFDLARALRELPGKPKQRGGRKAGPITPGPTAPTTASVDCGQDPATRFRLARAGQEELRLAKMRGLVERVAVVKPRVFHLIRGDRDRLLAWVSRAAPLIAAELRVDEGATWRAIQRAVSTLLDRLAAIKLPVEDPGHAKPRPEVQRDATPVPRDAETRFQLARARQEEHKLRKMQREHVDLGEATRRLATFRHRTLQELAGWVPRVAPTIAAEVGAEVGVLARAMAHHLGQLRADLAAIDVAAALRVDPVEEGNEDDGDEDDKTETPAPPKGERARDRRGPPPPRAHRGAGPPRDRRNLPRGDAARSRARRR